MNRVIYVTDDNFNEQVRSGIVLVSFFARWCGPCKAMAPTLDVLAKEYTGRVTILKVDIDKCPNTMNANGVERIPTMQLYSNGELFSSATGRWSKEQVIQFIEQAL
ncbi:thioredoxin family protein [Pseudoalteromonas citrea]|nr:thioredoxin family protein [Pseudoalteromonas citrea]